MNVLARTTRSASGQLFGLCYQGAIIAALVAAVLSSQAMAQAPDSRDQTTDASAIAREAETADRLRDLLVAYYQEEQQSLGLQPSAVEMARRNAAGEDALQREQVPFSGDTVHLNGAQGSAALIQITHRLTDPALAESRREVAPTCSIESYASGSLVSSEFHDLQAVGKHHFIAQVAINPGDTVLRVLEHSWEVNRPADSGTGKFIVTLYKPPASKPELHVFAIDELLAEEDAHIPAWLPEELNIETRAG